MQDKIAQNRLDRGFQKYQEEIESAALRVLRSGWYILGPEVENFEKEFAEYVGSRYCVGLANGLDALWLAFRVLGIGAGDEVIVQGNTYIASVMGITINGAKPVFVEPDEFYNIDVNKIEEKINPKTKAVLVVHLYGQASNMESVVQLCKKYDLRLVEDCAQSHGAYYDNKMTGIFGDIGCFSFYPSKNLGAYGDAGAIVTDNDEIAQAMKMYRNYGSEKRYYNKVVGANSRLDELQAAMLRVRLRYLDDMNAEREEIAKRYLEGIDNSKIVLPIVSNKSTHVWHQFVIRVEQRDELQLYLDKQGIGTIIHYPVPPHLSEAYAYLGYEKGDLPITEAYADTVISLPVYNGMTLEEQKRIIDCLNAY